MTAQEAKEMSELVNASSEKNQYNRICNFIFEYTQLGLFSLRVEHQMPPNVRKRLTEDGFSVGETHWENKTMITEISWK